MRFVMSALGLAGCFAKPPAPEALDAAVVQRCAGTPFPIEPVQSYGDFGGAVVGDPTMADDGLELYFTYDPAPTTDSYKYDIRRAVRASASGVFLLGQEVLPFNMAGVVDTDSSITADGLMIAFVSQRPDARVYVATRTSRFAMWSSASLMPGLESTGVDNIDLSNDGLDLYFADGSGVLRQASRKDRTDPFMLPALDVYKSGGTFPSVSSDGLELFINGSSEIVVAQRPDVTSEFMAMGPPLSGPVDPDISPDGGTLLALLGGFVVEYRRSCM